MCGALGLYSTREVFHDLYQGLLAIQRRGQDSAGIITYDGRFHTKKANGLVRDIFTVEHARRLRGHIGIGHTRYPTIGGGRRIFFIIVQSFMESGESSVLFSQSDKNAVRNSLLFSDVRQLTKAWRKC